jgi:nitrogen fixation/metabolism regulation signal transduction histidine kinase
MISTVSLPQAHDIVTFPQGAIQCRIAYQHCTMDPVWGKEADMLDAARLQRGTVKPALKPIELVPVVERSMQLARNLAQAQRINFEPTEMYLVVHGDAGRIEQVLLNLNTNAVIFAPEAAGIDVRLFRAGNMVCIEVQDCGPSISMVKTDKGTRLSPTCRGSRWMTRIVGNYK